MIKVLTITLLLSSFSALAEYRVYQYIIKDKIVSAKDQPNSKILNTTLDPVSYMAYNGGSRLVSVDLLRTWMCAGHTGNKKDLCSSPYGALPAEVLQ
jgi:hypothetical protein